MVNYQIELLRSADALVQVMIQRLGCREVLNGFIIRKQGGFDNYSIEEEGESGAKTRMW